MAGRVSNVRDADEHNRRQKTGHRLRRRAEEGYLSFARRSGVSRLEDPLRLRSLAAHRLPPSYCRSWLPPLSDTLHPVQGLVDLGQPLQNHRMPHGPARHKIGTQRIQKKLVMSRVAVVRSLMLGLLKSSLRLRLEPAAF